MYICVIASVIVIVTVLLGRPFVLQVVMPHENCWKCLTANKDSLHETFAKCRYASWYQFFPPSASECDHGSLRQCLTHFVQPNLPLYTQFCHFISRSPGNPCLREDAGVVGRILYEALARNILYCTVLCWSGMLCYTYVRM